GDKVKVKVKSVDKDSERISLSIKDTLPSPFESLRGEINEGENIEGKVVRLTSFGAFVEIKPGVQGLVHISEISHSHIGTPGEVVSIKILSIDIEKERISLSIKATLPDENVVESDSETTQSYLDHGNDDEDNPTLGDVFGDKLKDIKF